MRARALVTPSISIFLVAPLASLSGCKVRSFNSDSLSIDATGNKETAVKRGGESGDTFTSGQRSVERRAGLAILFPPARDENGRERLPKLLDFGFTSTDFDAILKVATGENPSAAAVEAGDVVNADTPRARRTITNESCLRDPTSWRLTTVQSLPYERAIPGPYTAVAAFEKEAGRRLLVPLTLRATFQPWCVSERTPTRTQVFVLEQAIQMEFRVYDVSAAGQRNMAALVDRVTTVLAAQKLEALKPGADATGPLLELADALSSRERLAARRELLGTLEELTHAWRRGHSRADLHGFTPFEEFLKASAREGFTARAENARASPPVHPGFGHGPFEQSLLAYLKKAMTKDTFHLGRTSFSESQGAPVHAQFRFVRSTVVPLPLDTFALLKRADGLWQLQRLASLGFYDSARDTGMNPGFEAGDARARAAFDELDVAPASMANLTSAERTALHKRLGNTTRFHPTSSHCMLCHGLGAGTLLGGHTETEGAQLSAFSVLRASEDAEALARELGAD